MGKIHVLDKHVAELIAAGEVVERPASVIKELVENSIDASATAVTVEIQQGGTTFMRVTDNGSGVARSDVPLAFVRHATSKVEKQDDLERIGTLGFRGEALASVASVARVMMLTRTKEELAGTRYEIEGGEELACEDAGCAQGTTLVVRDLFYNTPARMKFLKKNISEANAVAAVIDRAALSHPEVAFHFIRDGKEALTTPGDGKLQSCIYAVYGKEFARGLTAVDYALHGVRVRGYISLPSNARPNRSMQHFFLNGRYVKSKTAMVALEEAFKGSIMVGKFPACVLHISLAYEAVDVNVHPAKIEVRFVNEKPIFDAVYHGVKSALLQGDQKKELKLPTPTDASRAADPARPPLPTQPVGQEQLDFAQENKEVQRPQEPPQPEVFLPPPSPYGARPFVRDAGAALVREAYRHPAEPVHIAAEKAPPQEERAEQPPPLPKTLQDSEDLPCKPSIPAAAKEEPLANQSPTPFRFIGEAFHTYILIEQGDALLLIDKHAAHERMLYEKLKKESGKSHAQLLLQPVPVTLPKEEYAAILEQKDTMAQAGFDIDDFGAGTVLVRSAPLSLEGEDIPSAIMEMAGYLVQNKQDISTQYLDWLYHNIACRAAIKAGARTSPQELAALAVRVREDPDIRYCPHGRPVSILLKRSEIEKQFGRA